MRRLMRARTSEPVVVAWRSELLSSESLPAIATKMQPVLHLALDAMITAVFGATHVRREAFPGRTDGQLFGTNQGADTYSWCPIACGPRTDLEDIARLSHGLEVGATRYLEGMRLALRESGLEVPEAGLPSFVPFLHAPSMTLPTEELYLPPDRRLGRHIS